VGFGPVSGPLGAPGSADVVITARNLHNWAPNPAFLDRVLKDSFTVLKPGGVFAVEEHRSDPKPDVPGYANGYMSEASVIAAAEKAGFKLAARSEVNANPKDTKDHPFGVWTLPPIRRTAPLGQPSNPAFDRTKYDAIGESDRMTLRFVKPKA
jgi:predicted methyltransferase